MKIIERIEIHRFRSISDSTIFTEDLNIFSGTNNSGKSNVLRALNLFFNGETSFNRPYDFLTDYNRAFTGQAGGRRVIRIILHFAGQGDAALKLPFSISRDFEDGPIGSFVFHSTDSDIDIMLKNNDGNIKRQFTTFLNKIEYFYIPAVRDREFVRNLFLNFEKLIDNDRGSDFEGKMAELSEVLEDKSVDISKEFQEFIGLPTEAVLSSKITDILGAIQVNVDSGIEITRRLKGKNQQESIKVNLFSSGDGILMSYLAYFLAHICRKLANKRFIWGFEEPENSLEYSKAQRLAQDFNDKFLNDAQIFLTTHSPAFINLKEKPKSTFYRVYIRPEDKKRSTEIMTLQSLEQLQQSLFRTGSLSAEYELIQKELGLVESAEEIERALNKLITEQRHYIDMSKEFETNNKVLLDSRPLKIFICEDEDRVVIAFWEKILAMFGGEDIKVLSSGGSSNERVEIGVLHQQRLDPTYKPFIFREVDRDGLLDSQIDSIQQKLFAKYESRFTYSYAVLPVNEIENFAVLNNPAFDDDFYNQAENIEKVRTDFDKTAEAVIKKFDRAFGYSEGSGFRLKSSSIVELIADMRKEAGLEWRRYMPGKSIAARMDNFSPIAYLDGLDKRNIPVELKDYINGAINFFNQD